ncbi:MAG: shikimate dehydrogenase [Chromatiales bacterium]|nr:shikimate dehydrogenase [Chromatiales bacterium]
MGNPIAHSKSPQIHAMFAEQTGQSLHYSAILVAVGGFERALRSFHSLGGRGLNVTVPFKREAWERADERSDRAELAGAVNTLSFREDGSLRGDNTDGVGLVRDLTVNLGLGLAGKELLLLGAGGAASGVLAPLLGQRPARVVIANRTVAKAVALAGRFTDTGPVEGCGYEDLSGRRFDLVINATATSLLHKVPPLPRNLLRAGAWCYDMMYSARPTAFVQWGLEHGAEHSVDGLGMLVEQAAESFLIWRGVRPESGPVIRRLRDDLARALATKSG